MNDAESLFLPASGRKVCFIIPTLRRPDFLRKCLRSVAAQTRLPDLVLVAIKPDDISSPPVLDEFAGLLQLRAVAAGGIGVVGAMNSCLTEASGDFIGLLDDDIELPAEWLEKMLGHLCADPELVGSGGRDALQDHPEMRRREPRTLDVGRIHWFGRITGNHHRGAGSPRRVHILRGSNCLFRADFLKRCGFERGLRGKGAQVHWELALALQARIAGGALYYDPCVEIVHHVAPRTAGDHLHRGAFDPAGATDVAFNETYVVGKYARGCGRMAVIGWQLLVGSPHCPGLIHFIRSFLRPSPHRLAKLRATLRGRGEALREVRNMDADDSRPEVRVTV